jgi:DNA-binding response OmpR family regulator
MTAILRRIKGEKPEEEKPYEIGRYVFDHRKQELVIEGNSQRLTTKENDLLKLLAANKNGIVERNFALSAVWGDDSYFNGRSMDVYIAKLRKYLAFDSNIEIVNVHGKGFKLVIK